MHSNLLIKPVITELAINEAQTGKYTFAVQRWANKNQIRTAIGEAFSVHVLTVQTRIMKGKSKRAGTKRTLVMGQIWKKATVTVKKGEKIAIFEPGGTSGEEEEDEKKKKK
jgi:large subunit ribosomal protein L23